MRRHFKSILKLVSWPVAVIVSISAGYLMAVMAGLSSNWAPLLSAIIGVGVSFVLPVWQNFFIISPKLSIEVNSIKRTIVESAPILIDNDHELRAVLPQKRLSLSRFIDGAHWDYSSTIFGAARNPTAGAGEGFTIKDLENALLRSRQRLKDLPIVIEERKREYEKVKSFQGTQLSRYTFDQLNSPIDPEVEFDESENGSAKMIKEFIEAYKSRLEDVEKSLVEIQSGLPAAERKIDQIRRDLVNSRSFFTVSASLVNSGRANTAIKIPALLRVSIGEGNYIDIKMTLKDFEEKSEISASGTRIVVFESSEISSLPEEDRKLINTYWGQSVRAVIFLEDIRNHTYQSNAIAFAEGLYQKTIYDRLSQAANNSK